MADIDYSSLREAVNRIVGAPAGGTPDTQDVTQLAPRTPYSQDLQTPTTTTAAISNTPYDPFAAQNAENAASLASLTAQNNQLVTQTAPAGLGAGKPQLSYADQLRSDLALSGITGSAANRIVSADLAASGRTAQTAYDPSTMALNPAIAARPAGYQPTTTTTGNMITVGGARAPVKPGANAPWQASQQYWKDLAAYKGQ